jgi:hypothetical protein
MHNGLETWAGGIAMEKALQGYKPTRVPVTLVTLVRGLSWGLVGGLTGTLVMDLVLMGALSAVGLPALSCFAIIGDTVARFFSILGVATVGGVPTGVLTHYLIGPLVGIIFGVVVTQAGALRVKTVRKSLVIAVLYVEILSQPILATTPLLVKMTAPETLQWFGLSFVMHFILAVVLGAVVGYGLCLHTGANRR